MNIEIPGFEDSFLLDIELLMLFRPRTKVDSFFQLGLDFYPNDFRGKDLIFENYSVPLLPVYPEKERRE